MSTPDNSAQYAGTVVPWVVNLMERMRHVTPYMAVAAHHEYPIFLFMARETEHAGLVLHAWDEEMGYRKAGIIQTGLPQWGQVIQEADLPPDLENPIRVYADTPGFRRARQGLK